MDDMFFSMRPGFPWSVDPIGLPALAVLATLLVLFTIWTYLGHPQATRRRMMIILSLRLAALFVTLLTAVRPSVGVNENPKQPSVLLVGIDTSESMTVKDAIGGQSRIDAVRKTLEKCEPLFEDLRSEHGVDIVFYRYGPLDFNEATSMWEPSSPADGNRSDHGVYLNRTFERWQSEPRIRGHIMIGDFRDNGESYLPTNEAARWARRGVAINGFLVGSDASGSKVKDIAVVSLTCNPSPAYVKNKVLVTARVNAYNFAGARVTARVSINDEPIWSEDFTLEREMNNDLRMTVPTPEIKGEYKIKVEVGIEKDGKIVELPGELSGLNNQAETYLTVLKEGVSILFVDLLRTERIALIRALSSEPRFTVHEAILQRNAAPNENARMMMNLDNHAYDVIIIGNLSAAELERADPEFLRKLRDRLDKKSVGVMLLGGEYAFEGMDTLLPIVGGPIIDDLDENGEPRKRYAAIPTTRGIEKMFRVTGKPGEPLRPEDSEKAWNRMNHFLDGMRLNGYNRLTLPKGGRHTVYAWTTDSADPTFYKAGGDAQGDPLLVGSQSSDLDKGRWLAFGAFDTYFWRSLGQPGSREGIEMHERFWRQCVLWLAHQDEEESQVYARPEYRQMKVTQEQTIRVGVKRPDGSDDPGADLTVRILPLAPGQKEPTPEAEEKAPTQSILKDEKGRKVLFRPTQPGEYYVLVTTPGKKSDGSPETLRGSAKFIVVPDISDEMLRVNADPEFMKRLTLPTGGKALMLEDLPGFLNELKAETKQDVGKKPRYYPDWRRERSRGFLPLWLVVFVSLLGAEWGLRRVWGMV